MNTRHTKSPTAKYLVNILTLAFCVGAVALAQPPSSTPPAEAPKEVKPAAPVVDEQAMMKAWMDLATPGPEHAALAKLVGTFDAKIKTWDPMKPGAEPMLSEGTMTYQTILDGRYMHAQYKGTFFGMPFNGGLLWGYSNATKKYQSIWVDSMGTTMMFSEGTSSDGGKTINSTSKMVGPGPDGKLMEYVQREQVVIESADKHVSTMWHVYPQGEQKMMEITYVRKAGEKK